LRVDPSQRPQLHARFHTHKGEAIPESQATPEPDDP
jgi:hypothetical protein